MKFSVRKLFSSGKYFQNIKINPKDSIKNLAQDKISKEDLSTQRKLAHFKAHTGTIHYLSAKELTSKILTSKSRTALINLYQGHHFSFSDLHRIELLEIYLSLRKEKNYSQIIKKICQEISHLGSMQDRGIRALARLQEPEALENLISKGYICPITALWALGKTGVRNLDLLQTIIQKIEIQQENSELLAKDLCRVIWSLGKLRVQDDRLLGIFYENLEKLTLSGRQLAMVGLGLKQLENKRKLVGQFMSKQLAQCDLSTESVLTLITLATVVGRFQVDTRDFERLGVEIMNRSQKEGLSVKFASELGYYLSKNNVYNKELYEQLGDSVLNTLDSAKCIDLAQLMQAFLFAYKKDQKIGVILDAIGKRIFLLRKKFDFKSKQLLRQVMANSSYKNESIRFALE